MHRAGWRSGAGKPITIRWRRAAVACDGRWTITDRGCLVDRLLALRRFRRWRAHVCCANQIAGQWPQDPYPFDFPLCLGGQAMPDLTREKSSALRRRFLLDQPPGASVCSPAFSGLPRILPFRPWASHAARFRPHQAAFAAGSACSALRVFGLAATVPQAITC